MAEAADASPVVEARSLWKLIGASAFTASLCCVPSVVWVLFAGSSAIVAADQLSNDLYFGIARWLLYLVALALAALSVARDFELGTIRNLLVAQPRRGILLSGKLLAQGSFMVIGIAVAGVVSVVLAYALAPGKGTSTDLWTLGATLETVGLVAVATILYGLLGAALGMVTRSAAISITIGAGYLLIAERLISLIWDTSGEWLPAGILAAFAAGGTQAVSFGKAASFVAIYAVLALAVTFTVFLRRDVTD